MPMLIFVAVILIVLLVIIGRNVVIVEQTKAFVVERFGAYRTTWETGLHVKTPFIDRIANRISLKEQVLDYPPQPVITKDNVTMQIDTVVYYQITDPKLYTYGIENPLTAIEKLTATTLRNLIGDMELDQTLTSRDTINGQMRVILDEATDPWGIKVNRVEVKNIQPPTDIQNSMEKMMKAERDRRANVLQAEGEKQAAILKAEGERESALLRADAEKQATILRAEGEKEAAILEAEAEAARVTKVRTALADSIKVLNSNAPSKAVLQYRSIEAMENLAASDNAKVIVPAELQGVLSLAESVVEGVKK